MSLGPNGEIYEIQSKIWIRTATMWIEPIKIDAPEALEIDFGPQRMESKQEITTSSLNIGYQFNQHGD